MATVNEEKKEKQLAVSGEQIENIIKKSAEIDKNTADIKDIKKALTENGGSLDLTEITERVDTLEADYTKLSDFVVTNAADIASEKVRFNNFKETTKPIEEVTYTKEETDAAITAKVAEIVADAPEDFNTLKEMSDWLTNHENSAATMNTAIQQNTNNIAVNATAIQQNTNNLTAEVQRAKEVDTINSLSLGVQCVNMFNKNGEINTTVQGSVISSGNTVNTVEGNVITFNRRSGNEFITGQFINGLSGKTVKITFNCISTGSASQGTFRIYKRDNTTALLTKTFSTGEQSYTYSCGANDELLFSFGGNGTAAGVQVEYLMIRDSAISDDTYKDYIPSLQEQINTLAAQIAALTTATTGGEA